MNTDNYADPALVGTGIWFSLHIDAVHAVTDESKEHFIVKVNNICDNFKCKKCQPHFRKFIDTYPLTNYWNIIDEQGNDIGFFKWTWELHNQVNKFLKKYQPTLQEAYNYFSDKNAGVCFNCVSTHVSKPVPQILTLVRENNDVKQSQPFRLISK